MSRKSLVVLAAGGSAALLICAFIFQALGYLPCQMCLWQRWPHGGAILAGGLAVLTGARLFIALGGLSALTTGAIGAYHAGVEQHWWPGPSSCTSSGGLTGLSGSDLLSMDGPKLILCDDISWQFLWLSMPAWNAVFSLLLVALWIAAWKAGDA